MIKYGLIGYPLSHSFSKKYFEDKFERELLNSRFELYPIQHLQQLPALLRAEPLLQGLAVTIPHKQDILKHLDAISSEANEIGAVNCIRITNGKLKGFNTDVLGFEKSLFPLLQPHHDKALVLGSGGSSKAVQFVLKKLQINFTVVSSSKKSDISYAEIDQKIIEENLLIINCTPLGMFPEINDKLPLPYKFVTPQHLLFDLIYNPQKTAFLQQGENAGAVVKNGLEMLYLQAEENWRIWNANG